MTNFPTFLCIAYKFRKQTFILTFNWQFNWQFSNMVPPRRSPSKQQGSGKLLTKGPMLYAGEQTYTN